MRIVDAHHHLWDLDACHYPWLMERGVKRFFGDPAPIQKNYLVSDLREDAVDYELVDSVHIQVGVAPGDEICETKWLQATGDREGLPGAIVAFCELEAADAPQKIEAQMNHARLRGVRQIIGRSDAEDAVTGSGQLVADPAWREGLELLGELGLSFDLQLTPPQVPAVIEALASAPDTQIALCHCGSPWDQTVAGLESWRQGLRLLADSSNVHCKISGLGMFDHNWSVDSIRPIVESCIEIFGVGRSMFGSNFPVDKLHASYSKVWGAYDEITSGLSEADRQALFVDNAKAFYSLAL